jgi:hypothetical protein
MINTNKPFLRILLVSIALLTGLYLFVQSYIFIPKYRHNNNQIEALEQLRFPDDYFHYGSSAWQHENPTHLTYPHDRFKAAFITFIKNDRASLTKLRLTIRNLEDQFNKHHHYPYIIFTDQELDEEYRELASSLVGPKTTMRFEKVDKDLYGYHPSTDLKKAEETRIAMNSTMFGESEDYRFQSRFMAGTIFR